MEINSKIIEHSISELGNDIITWELTFPKWLLAEFNTHKVEIERNSASSRAVPTQIIINMIETYPVLPSEWRYNTRGMQGADLLNEEDTKYANDVWLQAKESMIYYVNLLRQLPSGQSADKQRVNRLLEPWMWTVVVCTMTGGGRIGINNFFGLRDNEAAQPEFRKLAHQMHEQYHNSYPIERLWHLPYNDYTGDPGLDEINYVEAALISSSRCGRVTHYKQGIKYDLQKEIERGKSFAEDGHFSPLRHASRAGQNKWYGNMYGWIPISKIILPVDYIVRCCERSK